MTKGVPALGGGGSSGTQDSPGQGRKGRVASPGPERGILVVVESAAKARTVEACLGPGYRVLATLGSLVDLPKSRLGIDTERGFEPEYRTIRGRAGARDALLKAARASRLVFLATDHDREGEALASQLLDLIRDRLPTLPVERIVYDEITPEALRTALAGPRSLDAGLVQAQRARRILDRLVGYGLSPLLWKKAMHGLSAGRVQSVALRLICDREFELESWVPRGLWTLRGRFRRGRATYEGELVSLDDASPALSGEAACESLIGTLAAATGPSGSPGCVVSDLRVSETLRAPAPPLTTAALLRTAAERLRFPGRKTMRLAQQLYEGIELEGRLVGLITFPRSESVRVPATALKELRAWLGVHHPAELPGEAVLHPEPRPERQQGAIRPTSVGLTPDSLGGLLGPDQLRLYSLVWERFVASQMNPAKSRLVTMEVAVPAGEGRLARFRLESSFLVEKGYLQALRISEARVRKESRPLPELAPGETLGLVGFEPLERPSGGPRRLTDATIVEALEREGIGRPSTFVPILSVLLERRYVERIEGELVPTRLGREVCGFLVRQFPDLVDTAFTAGLEAELDRLERGSGDWRGLIGDFWMPFKARLDEAGKGSDTLRVLLEGPTGLDCELCGKPLVRRLGRSGPFIACSGFPACRNTRSLPLAKCPRPGCGGDLVARRRAAGRGREFYGCTRWPDCDFVLHHRPAPVSCASCGGLLVERRARGLGTVLDCINPSCDRHRSAGEEREHGPAD